MIAHTSSSPHLHDVRANFQLLAHAYQQPASDVQVHHQQPAGDVHVHHQQPACTTTNPAHPNAANMSAINIKIHDYEQK